MLRLTALPFCLLAAVAFGAAAQPAPHRGPPPGAYADDGPPEADAPPPPPVGYDVGYDYGIANDPASDADPYYQYPGPPPTDPRAREQTGLRDGVLPIKPRTSYYAGVRLYGDGYGYGNTYGYGSDACGCAHYRRRYTVYYDDFGRRGDSYRGYGDHPREDYGRGYGE